MVNVCAVRACMCMCGSTMQALTALKSLQDFGIEDRNKRLFISFLKDSLVPFLRHLDPAVRKQAAATIGTELCGWELVPTVRTLFAH